MTWKRWLFMTRKIGRLINESVFLSLNNITWPIRNIVKNPRSIPSFRYFESFFVYDVVQILYISFFWGWGYTNACAFHFNNFVSNFSLQTLRLKSIIFSSIYVYIYIYIYICCIVTYVDSHLHTCTYICRIIHSDTTIKTLEGKRKKTSLQLYLPLTLFVRFACERVLETEQKTLYFDLKYLWPSRCAFLVLLDAQPEFLGPLLDAGFLYGILSASSLDP